MKVIFPGSFHPPTLGHIHIIRRASALFDEVVVAVMVNAEKTCLFPAQTRVEMLQACVSDLPNVSVLADSGLLADLSRHVGADAILRSLRSAQDYEYEGPLAVANRQIGAPETIYLSSDPAYAHISSTIAMDVARHHGPLQGFVPGEILDMVEKAFR